MLLWTRRGTQGSIWHRAWATLPTMGQQRYQVRTRPLQVPGTIKAQGV